MDPEKAHTLTILLMKLTGDVPFAGWLARKFFSTESRPVKAFGLDFPNPVGLAAGYDKDGLGWRGLANLGFGHIEVGTVTKMPQSGNPRPRVFRLVEDLALINRMGFPGKGASFVANRLKQRRKGKLILGVNIGKNKDTPMELAAEEYSDLVKLFSPLADYIAVNISSPNTIGLRRLQARNSLEELLGEISKVRNEPSMSKGNLKIPILVKLAPDLTDQELEDALDVIVSKGLDGVIATNTTIDRPDLKSKYAGESGGLSGYPLQQKSLGMVRQIKRLTNDHLPVIGVGGVMNANDAQNMLDDGAVLIQVYSGLIYRGPGLVPEILKGINYQL